MPKMRTLAAMRPSGIRPCGRESKYHGQAVLQVQDYQRYLCLSMQQAWSIVGLLFWVEKQLLELVRLRMTAGSNTTSRDVVLVNELGLHARSAASIVRVAKNAHAGIWVALGDERADATSVLDLLGLACAKGTTLTLGIDDPQDAPVLEELVRLVESGFGE